MDDTSDYGSETSERTVLSDPEDETPGVALHRTSLFTEPKEKDVHSVSNTTQLANIWQFLLSHTARELTRFYAYNFLLAETVTDFAEGTSYRVSKSKLLVGDQQVVAIKHVKFEQASPSGETASGDVLETVLRELRVLAHEPVRKNANVAQLVGYGAEELEGRLSIYLVSNFASGGTLKDYLTEHGDVSMLERAHFCYDISTGLAGLHACKIVQGDLKLANVLVFVDGEDFVAKLSDFGCSIFEDGLTYTGSMIYNAPEIRHGRSDGFPSVVDMYASDVFSMGLVVWEILQGGRSFIDPALKENQLVWLNRLPKDELLLQALQDFEMLPIDGIFPKRVMRGVLESSLRDDPQLRHKSKPIVELFRSDRIFSNSKRNTSSYINSDSSKIPPLQKWAFTRTDKLATTVPLPLQRELLAQLKNDVGGNTKATIDAAHFHLAMCHLTGFGTSVSRDDFLKSLTRGAACGDTFTSGIYLRMHCALQTPTNATLLADHPIIQVEIDLQKLPNELYYSHRVRRHEKAIQRMLLKTKFDLYLGAEVLKKDAVFERMTTDVTTGTDRDVDMDLLDTIAMSFSESSDNKLPLLAVSDAFDREGHQHLFHMAARSGLKVVIERLLDAGIDVNTRDNNQATPLIAACRGGHADIVHLLMDRGADSWKRQSGNLSAFHWLMMFEDHEVSWVLEKMRSTHNSMVMDSVVSEPLDLLAHGLRLRWSPVHYAVEVRNMTVTKALLEAGASIRAGDTTPLNIAVANHCPEMTALLLAHGMPDWQLTPFLNIGEVSTFKLLLLHGDQRQQNLRFTAQMVLKSAYGNVNQKSDYASQKAREGYTPLAEAIRVMPCDIDMGVLECLLDCGAQFDIDEEKIVYCLKAREDGRAGDILKILIERKAIEITTELLIRAVIHGSSEIFEPILGTGIDVNIPSEEGLSPISCAVLFSKNAHAVRALISHGADVNAIIDIEPETKSVLELCMALPEGDGQMLDALIEGGAAVFSEDGPTIVFQASMIPAKINGVHVLQHLLQRHPHLKAYVNREHDHNKPIDIACFCGNLEAVSILLENGAEVDITSNYNPISITEYMARNPEERSVPFERGGFKLDRWKLTAETILIKLLDRSDPGHGRNLLHIAASICNYERVVELVERGVQPWRGDSKKVTPIGSLPQEVFDYDDTQNDGPPKDFIVQGLKIKKYLEHHMILQTSQVDSLDLIYDPPVSRAPETDSPAQLEVLYKDSIEKAQQSLGEQHSETLLSMQRLAELYMMEERWAEAEQLLSRVVRDRQAPEHKEGQDCDEVRSSLIATLIAVNKLNEARSLVDESLAEAISEALGRSGTLQIPSQGTMEKAPKTESDEHAECPSGIVTNCTGNRTDGNLHETVECVDEQRSCCNGVDRVSAATSEEVPLFPKANLQAGGAAALDRFVEICSESQEASLALILFDVCRFNSVWDENFKGIEMMKYAVETIRPDGTCSRPLYIRLVGELICRFCALEQWKEAKEELQYSLGRLEFIAADYFPPTYSMLLQVADVFKKHQRWIEAEEIYQKIYAYTVSYRGLASYYSIETLRLIVNLFDVQLKYKEAGKYQSKLLEGYKQRLGPHSAQAQWERLELAQIYEKEDRLVECVILQRQALQMFETLGDEHRQNTLEAKRMLCKALRKQQVLDEAEVLAREVWAESGILHGEGGAATLAAMNILALVLNNQERCEEAIVLYKQILQTQEKTFGEMHESTRLAMTELLPTYLRANMFEEAEILGKRLVKVSEALYGSESMVTLHVLFYLSSVYEKSRQFKKSRDIKLQVLELERKFRSPGHKETFYTMTELAQSHYALGDIDEAITLQLEALDGYRRLDVDNTQRIIETVFDLACSYHEIGKLEEARLHYEEAITMSRSLLGDKDERTINKLAPLMALYTEIDQYELAKTLAYETLWFMEKAHGDDHSLTQEARRNVIIVITSMEECRSDKVKAYFAESQAQKLVASLERTHGIEHADTIDAVKILADWLKEQNKHAAAEPLYNRVLAYKRKHLPPEDDTTLDVISSLVTTLRNLDRFDEAAALNQELLDIHTRTLGPTLSTTLETTAIKAYILFAQKHYTEATALETEILATRLSVLGPEHSDTLEAKDSLSRTYFEQGRYDEATRLREEIYKVHEKKGLEDTDEDMLDTIEGLKDVYIKMQKWEDARKMVNRELIARRINTKEDGDRGVIAALRSLKIVAEGEGDEGEVREVDGMIEKQEAAREEKEKPWWKRPYHMHRARIS